MTQSHETQTPEQIYTTEEINDALGYAQRAVTQMQLDPSFHTACIDAGIHPARDNQSSDYWHAFRMYVGSRVDEAREKGQDPLRMDAVELLSATPAFLAEQQKLRAHSANNPQERRYSREITSWYNGVLRNFASNYPDTSARGLTRTLLTTAAETLHNRQLREAASNLVQSTVRGAQHELAFGQLLSYTGIPYRTTTMEEDLKGLDYIVGEGEHALGVDVKASLSEVENRGSERFFATKPNRAIVMYSMTLDSELHDRFFLDDSLAQGKANVLLAQLAIAEKVA